MCRLLVGALVKQTTVQRPLPNRSTTTLSQWHQWPAPAQPHGCVTTGAWCRSDAAHDPAQEHQYVQCAALQSHCTGAAPASTPPSWSMLPDASKNPFGSYAGNRTTLCRAAVLAKSTNRTTNKKQSDHAGAHYLVNTSYTRFWCRFLKSSYIRRYIVAALALANGHFHWIKAPSTQGFSILCSTD